MAEDKDKKTQDLFDEDEEEFEFSNYNNGNQEDEDFDNVVGCLQDIVIGQEFEQLQQKFFRTNYSVFEDTEENKMEYMTIFKDYQKIIEANIEKQLQSMIEDFQMKDFLILLPDRQDQIDEQLMDLLYSFTDFESFKALVLDYKKDFDEQERIEKLKTIKQTAKKTLSKANQIQQNNNNIFSSGQNKNIFSAQKSDPIQDMKNLKINAEKKKPSNQGSQQFQEVKAEDITEDQLQKSFFIDCRSLPTPQIQNKKNN